MKRLTQGLVVAGALLLGAGKLGAVAMENSNHWMDPWHNSKYGRSSAIEEARVKAERAVTAYREEAPAAVPAGMWIEDFSRAKLGRSSPMEEARLKAERAATAYREEGKTEVPPGKWIDEFWRAKYGRTR